MTEPLKVIILGRPNVGKSTLFNRLVGKRQSLVLNKPGITRDRIEGVTQWWVQGILYSIQIIDTGGLGGNQFAEEILKQVEIGLKDAVIALFLFDSQVGLTPLDEELLRYFKKTGAFKKVRFIGVVNKVDEEIHENRIFDFFTFGLNPLLTVSAEQGRGIEDLKISIIEHAKPFLKEEKNKNTLSESDQKSYDQVQDSVPRIAIIGRPNVGKSTLLNALLKKERMITSSIAGTTVDAIDSFIEMNQKPYVLSDTAGIRRKAKTKQGIEVLSVVQAKKTLEKSDAAILVLDGETGIIDQDEKLGGLIEESGCAVILLVNKWDTQRKNIRFTKDLAAQKIRKKMAFLKYAPLLFVSALRKEGLNDLGDLIAEILRQRNVKISTHEFSEWIRDQLNHHNPQNAKCYLAHQSGKNPPTFVCHVNDPLRIHFSTKRHLLNSLRERWGFMGNPVRLLFIEAKNRRSLPKKKILPNKQKVSSKRIKISS